MLNILLADDNILTRNQLNELLGQLGSRVIVVGQAMDGQQAVELACRLKPDLIIMDVEMPLKNGIEATLELAEKLPAAKVLALSNYDNFQYLRGMLKAGAVDYLLKHELSCTLLKSKLGEIEHLLSKETERAIREHHYSLAAKQSLLASLISGISVDPAYCSIMMQQPEFPSRTAALCILRITNYGTLYRQTTMDGKKKLPQSVLNLCSNLFASIHNGLITSLGQGEFVVLFNFDTAVSRRRAHEQLSEYLSLIKGNIKRLLGIDVLVDSSFIYKPLLALPSYYEQLSRQMSQKTWGELSPTAVPPIDILDERELINALEHRDMELCRQVLARVFKPLTVESQTSDAENDYQLLVGSLLVLLERYLMSSGLEAELALIKQYSQKLKLLQSSKELYQMVSELFLNLLGSMSCQNLKSYSPHIQKAVMHLQNNYAQTLSLSDVAELLGLSSSYFSKVFRDEVGSNFVDYLTELRISKAKMLLCETTMTITEIGRQTGFPNYNYFIRVFRERTGQTPMSYQKQQRPPLPPAKV